MAVLVLLLAVGAAALFAGSETRLASGTTIAGVDVGGLERADATALLTERSKAVEHTPVIFVAGGEQFRFTASQLGVRSDWSAAVAEAARATAGLRPVRGVRRLRTKLFGVDIEPHTSAYPSAVRFAVERIAGVVDRPAVDARLRAEGAGRRRRAGAAGYTPRPRRPPRPPSSPRSRRWSEEQPYGCRSRAPSRRRPRASSSRRRRRFARRRPHP